MKYASQYLQSAVTIIESYNGDIPLATFLKNFFSANKKFGSKDRKYIAQLCFAYFRLGHAAKEMPVADAIKKQLLLSNQGSDWQALFDDSSIPEVSLDTVFPFSNELSNGIDKEAFITNHFIQPDVFLRIRPGREEKMMNALQQAGIGFHAMSTNTLAVSAGTKLDGVAQVNKDYVIQDYSSQQVGELLKKVKGERLKNEAEIVPSSLHPSPSTSIWDCCAASGGKSILAKDILGNVDITVSDIRESILQNLQKRFKEAGIFNYKSIICDLSKKTDPRFQIENYDLVICDAPCSGSGTWARTPEQLYFFKKERIAAFQKLQQQIILNTINTVKPGGFYLYITCSAFKKENEEQTNFIQANSALRLVEQQIINGYTVHADTMFAALFKNS
ncbi:MAG: Fmu (Sun) domain-containing protein [Sediminibacterium sp.]|nr:Fmu (Sun) domain-containing protein [Sediminibacterium sp.]MBX9779146.1 Fmu (Sun) domain-containing protein [Chitinophagaceae bacterium]